MAIRTQRGFESMDPEKRRRISREGGRASLRGIARREVEDYDDENYEDDDYEDPQNRYEDDEDYDPYEPEDEYDDEDDDRDDDRRNVYGEGDDYDDDEGYADEYDDEDENYQDERHRSRGRDGRGFASMPREEVRRIAKIAKPTTTNRAVNVAGSGATATSSKLQKLSVTPASRVAVVQGASVMTPK